MTMRVYWALAVAVFIGFLVLTKAVLLPFIAGLAVAYLLDPTADKLEAIGMPRGAAASLVIALFFIIIVGIFLAFVPILQSQLGALAAELPATVAKLRPWLNAQLTSFSEIAGDAVPADVDSMLTSLSSEILGQLKKALSSVVAGGIAFVSLFGLILISPVVAFYLLRDWDKIVDRADHLLPAATANTIRGQITLIDQVLAGFVRGQLTISLVMGILYAVGWSAVGLSNGLLIGLLAGVLAIIPFIGMLFGALIAMTVAFGQWGFDAYHLGLVAGVYLFVQILESAFLTPKLVGDRVRLHPVWVLFAVFAGGEIMGFVGVLVAVPVAAAIAVLVRYALDMYVTHNQAEKEALGLRQTSAMSLEDYDGNGDTDPTRAGS